ncbi:Troponin C (TN-C) [Durusdinium trenchii]|uniref:Troponin C (TN-C) n=1 Tax=Durusdinium trenchii TaxID=1381693 RepID=A0ABP0NJG7_9DINO
MEILIAPGEPLGQAQKDEIAKAFKFLALKSDGARHRQREGLPMKVSRALVPQLLRGCGRAVSEKQLSELMGSVEEEGILLEDFYRLYEAAAQEPLPDEQQLLSALRALDVTRSGVLDVKTIQTILCTMGDRLPQSTVDEILTGLPKDGLGRVSCQRLVRKLLKGPDQMPHL